MSYITADERTRITRQIATKEAQLEAANTAYLSALTNSEVAGYMLDTGEGKQASTRRKPEDIARVIARLEAEITRLYTRLNGTGIINMNLRRRG